MQWEVWLANILKGAPKLSSLRWLVDSLCRSALTPAGGGATDHSNPVPLCLLQHVSLCGHITADLSPSQLCSLCGHPYLN